MTPKYIFSILLLCAFCSKNKAQHVTCDTERYLTEIFKKTKVTRSVLYGNNSTISGQNKDLFMDIYEPSEDLAEKRPLIILAFGGGFFSGKREDLEDLCILYSKKGFVTATIDYRLYDLPLFPIPSQVKMIDAGIKGVSDMKAAIRFFREDASTNNGYKIDPSLIFV